MATFVTFGEILLRLTSPNHLRLTQSESLDLAIAGAEANVAATCAVMGHQAVFVSAVPANSLGEIVRRRLRAWDVEPALVGVPGGRMGLYYLEPGTLQRPAEIIYDRAASAFACARPGDYDWDALLARADWFHTSGITPALSPEAAQSTREALAAAKRRGIPVSFDPNYRARLWSLEEARRGLEPLLEQVDVLLSGTGQIGELFGITSDQPEFEGAADVARQVAERYGIGRIVVPRRRHGTGGREQRAALFYDGSGAAETPWFDFDMIDPLGGGDAFAGALICAVHEGRPPEECARLAVAAACVKHSIRGDFLVGERRNVEAFATGATARGVVR